MDILQRIEKFIAIKSFNTRGLPLTKKLWRDGYNRALQDLSIFLETEQSNIEQREVLTGSSPKKPASNDLNTNTNHPL